MQYTAIRLLSLFFLLFGSVGLSAQTANAFQRKADPALRAALERHERPDVLIVMRERANVSAADGLRTKVEKGAYVFGQLSSVAERTQARARQIIHAYEAQANSLYIVNAIAIHACGLDLAVQLADLEEVAAIALDPWVHFEGPVETGREDVGTRSAIEWGIEKIQADAVWVEGFSGQGIVIGGADTGYDWTHPALNRQYRGSTPTSGVADHNYNWHDAITSPSPLNADTINPCGYNTQTPCDDQQHGTHTMGTMVGDDGTGNQIGVAPGARWIGCRNMERGWGRPSTYIDCFQWFLAPTDLNNAAPDPSKAPHVINNSWYCAEVEGCDSPEIIELMRTAIINLKAAGVVVVVSNGNFGGAGCASTTGPPAYFPESFSVGATQPNDTIAGFSSRGPVTTNTATLVKPNVCAPGTNTRSSVPGGGYSNFSGTSMAGPHVAGTVALILSSNAGLEGEVSTVEEIIESTCLRINGLQDCSDGAGTDYPNNTYGYGLINAHLAWIVAFNTSTDTPADKGLMTCYPSPVRDVLTLTLKLGDSAPPSTLTIINAQGQVVMQQKVSIAADNTITMPVGHLSAGIYYVTAQAGSNQLIGRFVKQ
jgi:serine protease AprX